MDNDFENIKEQWRSAREKLPTSHEKAEAIRHLARGKQRNSMYFQYGNIAVLSLVLVMIIVFFQTIFSFVEALSLTGIALMIGGLSIRIFIEAVSVMRFRKISMTDALSATAANLVSYYTLRRIINGPVTISLVAVYITGFLLLSPEFLEYVNPHTMFLFDLLFALSGGVLIWRVRKEIRNEMNDLRTLISLQQKLEEENSSSFGS